MTWGRSASDRDRDTPVETPEVGAPSAPSTTPEPQPYADAWAHLEAELARLDLLLQAAVLRSRRSPDDPLAQLQGLVITDTEVARLLGLAEDTDATIGSRLRDLDASARELRDSIDVQVERSRQEGVYLPLPYMTRLFQLTRAEEQCLLICLASEIDRKYDKLFGYLHDDVTRKRPSVDLVLELTGAMPRERLDLRSIFDPMAPLMRYRLVRFSEMAEGTVPLRARALALDDRIAGLLLGNRVLDPLIAESVRWLDPAAPSTEVLASPSEFMETRQSVRAYFDASNEVRPNVALHLRGPYGSGRLARAVAVGEELGLPLLRVDLAGLPAGTPRDEVLWRAARESLLWPAILCITGFDSLLKGDAEAERSLQVLLEAIQLLSRCTVLIGERSWHPQRRLGEVLFVELESDSLDEAAVADFWSQHADSVHASIQGSGLRSLAGRFRFTPGQVHDAMRAARDRATWRAPSDVAVTQDDIQHACRDQSSTALAGLARKIEPRYRWQDIVLPDHEMAQVRSISSQVRHRHIVFGDWGFGRKLSHGKGLRALFAGPTGTGKTMAAAVVANDPGLGLYKIDLSQVVSKYIGETEKNLDRVFAAAESASAILFFDEADALFGKRSEVRDSHDRYANVEISYLLQKMEEYEGIAILATNLRRHMDDAFLRRLQFVIEFPFPTRDYREAIWRVTLPPEVPLEGELDFAELARDVRLSGGNIKNICVAAAYLAAADGGAVSMSHIRDASRREYEKLGRGWSHERAVEVSA
ncbi:MAG: AAA family ATPase [bacterium]|nr:AAA family ATPase [bacterium]